jgi:DNA-binding CsgD family transcriptional regulator
MSSHRIMGLPQFGFANSMDAAVDEGSTMGDAMAQVNGALTKRESEVLRLLARGRSYGEIAVQLGVSVNTVATHIKKLYLKLDVHTAAAAVMRGVELRLLGRGG